MKCLLLILGLHAFCGIGQMVLFNDGIHTGQSSKGLIATKTGYINYRYLYPSEEKERNLPCQQTEITVLSNQLDTLRTIVIDSLWNGYSLNDEKILFHNSYGKLEITTEAKVLSPSGDFIDEFIVEEKKEDNVKYIGDFAAFGDNYLYRVTSYDFILKNAREDVLYTLNKKGEIIDRVVLHSLREYQYHNQHYKVRNFGRDALRFFTLGGVRLKKEAAEKTGTKKEPVLESSRPYYLGDSLFLFSNSMVVDLRTETYASHPDLQRILRLNCLSYEKDGKYKLASAFQYQKETILTKEIYDSHSGEFKEIAQQSIKGDHRLVRSFLFEDQSSLHLFETWKKKRKRLELVKIDSFGKMVSRLQFWQKEYTYRFFQTGKVLDDGSVQFFTNEYNDTNWKRCCLWHFDANGKLLNPGADLKTKTFKIK